MQKRYQYLHNVQYYETDQMKIVHHSNYIRWFEECRIAWMKECGIPCHELERKGIIIPVVDVTCEYKKMTRFGETVSVEMSVSKFNGVVIEFEYRVLESESKELRVIGKTSHCFLNEDYKVISLKKKDKEVYNLIGRVMSESK